MDQNTPIEIFVSWLPLILILAIWFFAMRRHRNYTHEILDMNRQIIVMNRDIQALNKSMCDTLLRIEKLLEDRRA